MAVAQTPFLSDPRDCRQKPIWTLNHLLQAAPRLVVHLLRTAPTFANWPIDGAFRERIMLAVAAENRCWYCQAAHRSFGEALGLDSAEVDRILAGDHGSFDRAEQLALDFVRDLARRGFLSRDEQLFHQLGDHYSHEQQLAIESAAHVMNLANRFGNSFDAARASLLRRCSDPGAPALDLGVLSALFMAGAAVATPGVGLAWLRAKWRR